MPNSTDYEPVLRRWRYFCDGSGSIIETVTKGSALFSNFVWQ